MASTLASLFIVLVSSLILQTSLQQEQGYGVLHAEGNVKSEDYCVMYNPQWGNVWPSKLDKTPKYPVVIASPHLLCSPPQHSNEYSRKAVVADRGNCSFFEKGFNAQKGGAVEAIIINYDNKLFMPAGNESAGEYSQVTIPLVVMAKDDGHKFKHLGKDVKVQLYKPTAQAFDGNIIILWILAVGTVATGAFWTAIGNKKAVSAHLLQQSTADNQEGNGNNNDDNTIPVTPVMVLVFVILICGLLLLLFYFYDYLVYVIIVLFAFASCNGLFECLTPVVLWLPLGSCKVPPNPLPILKNEPQIRLIGLMLFCVGMAIWWGIERNASYAWVLQDILGIAFCVSLMKNIRLPNLKICIILLMLLLVYDIFFVFITPLFSASGKSVMVEVATGGDHKEQLPMVLKVPRLTKSILSICARPYSLLGFGDILVPGLYIGFCHSFDIMAKTPRRIYFVATTIAYGSGLIITFVALFLMKQGQPALLYLVPCVLLTGVVIGWWRGELRNLWTGKMTPGSANAEPRTLTSDSEDEILDVTRKTQSPDSAVETQRLINGRTDCP